MKIVCDYEKITDYSSKLKQMAETNMNDVNSLQNNYGQSLSDSHGTALTTLNEYAYAVSENIKLQSSELSAFATYLNEVCDKISSLEADLSSERF